MKTEAEYPNKQRPVDWLEEADLIPWTDTKSVHVSYANVVDLKKYLNNDIFRQHDKTLEGELQPSGGDYYPGEDSG